MHVLLTGEYKTVRLVQRYLPDVCGAQKHKSCMQSLLPNFPNIVTERYIFLACIFV